MPTTIPERRVAPRHQSAPYHHRLSWAAILVAAAFVTVAAFLGASPAVAPGGDEVVQSIADFSWSSPSGFAP
jgi:hypothetical protein